MNATSRAILQTVITTDASLTSAERTSVQRLIAGEADPIPMAAGGEEFLLITQKRAAELPSVSRVTIYRMTRDCVLHPVEILPGTWRYPFREIMRLTQGQKRSESVSPRERAPATAA